MENSLVDKMKPLQRLYNLDKAGVRNPMLDSTDLELEYFKEWLGGIFDRNEEICKHGTKEEFINNALYGK